MNREQVTGDIPVPGDYSRIGFTQMATWRSSDHTWNVNVPTQITWGTIGDVPLPYAIRRFMGYAN
jgi:hypothetical protein